MRRARASRFSILLLCLLVLAGCKTASQGGGVKYNAFYGPDDHVEELLAAGKAGEASAVYNDNRQAFGPPGSSDQPLLDKLAAAVQADIQPRAAAALAQLRAAPWPAAMEQWPTVGKALSDARGVVTFAEGQAILALPGKGLPDVDTLRVELAKRQAAVEQGARAAFETYPIFSERHFFRDYPAPLNPELFLSQNQDLLWKRLASATPADIAALFTAYREELDDPCEAQVAEHYFRSILGGDPSSADIARVLHAAGETKKAGMPLTQLAGVKVAFVNVTSPTLLTEKQIEFPLHLDVDMPVDVQAEPLERAFASEGAKTADVIVVISMAQARTDRDMVDNDFKPSRFVAGTKEVINPEYQKLKVQTDQVAAQKMGADIRASIPRYGIAAIGQLADIAAAASYGSKLNELTNQLATTPPVIEEPVYQDYKVRVVDVTAEKIATVNYYVIDKRARTMFADTFDARATGTWSVAYEMQDSDVNKDAFLTDYASEETVVEWEKEPIVVSLSSLMAEFGKGAQKTKKIASLDEVMVKLVEDRNTALASAAARTYTDARNDARFDSVVKVISLGKGSGTGFYVAEDLIITNVHVVDGAKLPVLQRYDKREIYGKVIAQDTRLDLALIQVKERGTPVSFFSDNEIRLGEQLEIIGHPRQYDFSITRGIVSAVRHNTSIMNVKGKPVLFIQTDAAMHPGNSGGPVFMGNKVVGVSDWIRKDSPGINFSIHYSEVMNFLRKNGVTPRI